jgi:hypothetical protein
MRIALLTVFLLLLVLGTAKTSLACECADLPEKESFRRADLVFEGEVVRVAQADHRTDYTFAVHKLLKGSAINEVIITGTGTDCDEYFSSNVVYRVYARRFEDRLITGQCFGNKVVKTKKQKRARAAFKATRGGPRRPSVQMHRIMPAHNHYLRSN